jgi:hypothetical protein
VPKGRVGEELPIQGLHEASFWVLHNHGHTLEELVLGVEVARPVSNVQRVSTRSGELGRCHNSLVLGLAVLIEHLLTFVIEDGH